MKESSQRSIAVFAAIIFAVYISTFLLPLPAQAFGRLEDKIQRELDVNPFLKKHGIKLRVTDATAGYITVEMYEGNDQLR